MTDRETIDVYNVRVGDYAKLEPSDQPSDTLAEFIAALPDKGRVLDLGCGPGTSARHMARAGLQVTATDASKEMIALASQVPGVTAKVAVFEDLDDVKAYDGVWANFSLLHATRSDLPRFLRAIHTALNANGLFHIALKSGEGEARDRIGRFYTYYSEGELTRLLQDAGFTVGPFRRGRDKGLSGDVENWMSTTAHA